MSDHRGLDREHGTPGPWRAVCVAVRAFVGCAAVSLGWAVAAPQADPTRPGTLLGTPAVSEAVAARLALEHASADTFEHEALTTALGARIGAALAGDGAPLADLFAAEVTFRGNAGAPELTDVAGGLGLTRFGAGDARGLTGPEAATELGAVLASLRGTPPWKVKVLRSERRSPEQLILRAKLAPRPSGVGDPASSEAASGRVEVLLIWTHDTQASSAGDPLAWHVTEVTLEVVERVTARHGFDDVTAAVLAPSATARAQLAPSIPALRLGLDAAVGVGFLGHHGLAVGDVNGDGLDDLYLCQPGGLPDQLWLRRADGTAVEVGADLGLDLLDATSSALFVDLDNDGDQDLVRTTGDALLVHTNRGGALPETFAFPVTGATSLAAADVDGDARVDLFLCTYGSPYTGGGLPLPYHDARNGTPNVLLANRTGAADALAFEDVTAAAGMGGPDQRFSFAASFEDFDGDGDQDLYVANDFGRNHLWRNDASPDAPFRFVDVAGELGVEDLAAGMGVTWADFDLDGRSDLYVSNMFSSAGNRVAFDRHFHPGADAAERAAYQRHAAGNSLFFGAPDGPFEFSGAANLGLWAWGGLAFELDGDGRPDLYVPNGFVTGTNPDDL